ncbi:MAG TPA: zf-HC2 domain-containing protein [Anaerolineae bacterium]|nr:zf-HC2 domain-containing protein [Anaerolineae bacterium]
MGFLGRRLTDKERAEELFSPYLDGQVTDEERMFLERHLAAQPQAREKFELLKAAVQLTKSLPPVKAPRSFVLPRSLARKTSPALRLYPVMRLATVAAMTLFAFAFAGDLATQSRFIASAPAVVSATPEAGLMAATLEATTATPEPPAALEAAAPAPTGAPMPTQAEAASGAEPDKTADAANTPEAMARQAAAAPTPAATAAAQPEAAQAEQKTSLTSASAPATLQLDPLRLAWIVLAGLALLLTATTLIVRRHG